MLSVALELGNLYNYSNQPEHESRVVVVDVGVDEERAAEVHAAEPVITCNTSARSLSGKGSGGGGDIVPIWSI